MQTSSLFSKMFSFSDTAMAFWALVLSTITLSIQALSFLRSRLLKPKAEVTIIGFPEIGFSWFGPTISFWVQLRSIGKEVFVTSVKLMVENLRTHERHDFSWLTFNELRTDTLLASPLPQQTIKEVAAGFYLNPLEPSKRNILFHDQRTFFDELKKIYAEGNDVLVKTAKELGTNLGDPLAIEAFNNSDQPLKVYTELQKLFYWKVAEYRLSVIVNFEGGTAIKKFLFTVSEDESTQVSLNVAMMSRAFMPGAQPFYQFIYPKLKEEN